MRFQPLVLSLLGLTAVLATTARADDCDYLGRHYKADLVPTAIAVADTPRQGDLGPWQTVTLTVQNVGNTTIDYQARPGDLWHAVEVTSLINGQRYQGFLNVPFAGGATGQIRYSLPAGALTDCANVAVTIDVDHSARQSGCNVYADDSKTFAGVHIQGEHICSIIHWPPHGTIGVGGQ